MTKEPINVLIGYAHDATLKAIKNELSRQLNKMEDGSHDSEVVEGIIFDIEEEQHDRNVMDNLNNK